MKSFFRIIGDVHGHLIEYVQIALQAEYSLQVGDLGFCYDYINDKLDPIRHRVIGGNHDHYTKELCSCKGGCDQCEQRGYTFSKQSKHFLKDYGTWEVPDFGSVFYVRGAWSIDKDWRIVNVSWWEDEELTYAQGYRALDLYEKVKPEFVVTHTVPSSIIPSIPFNRGFGDKIYGNRTESLLENMYQIHQPLRWIFGHWHVDWRKSIEHSSGKNTEFICLKELGYVDFPKEGK